MRSVKLSPVSPSPTPQRNWTPLLVVAIFCATLAAYSPAIRGQMLWDDDAHITEPALRSLGGLWRIWFQLGATQQYYPMLHTAFWLEHRLWGDSLVGYHLLNIGLHATAACLLAFALARIRPGIGARRLPGSEWLAAAVFALHPVCVESVAWISEQKNTLSLVLYLLAALAYLRFDRGRGWGWYALGFGLFVLALLSKSVTATLPAALLLIISWHRGRPTWKGDVAPLLPWFAIGAAAGLFTAWVEHSIIGARGQVFDLGPVERLFLAGRIVWFYIGRLLWPANLMFIYPKWTVAVSWQWSLGCIGLAGIAVGFWRIRHWSRGPMTAFLFFVGSLFPALGFVNVFPFIFSYVADHFQYLASIGIIALVAEGGASVAGSFALRLEASARRVAQGTFGAAAGVLLALLGFLTWRQAADYRDAATLYSVTLARNPECWMAHNNLGVYLENIPGRIDDAIGQFNEAIRLRPDYPEAHFNLGNALGDGGRRQEAVSEFEEAIRLQPNYANAHYNLGNTLDYLGRTPEAIDQFREAVRSRPDFAEAHNNLGLALSKMPERLNDAVAQFREAVRLRPDIAEAHANLGNILGAEGRSPEAIPELEKALQLKPDFADAHFYLANVLVQAGRIPEALQHYERALEIQPAMPEASSNLGMLLCRAGHPREGLAFIEAAIRMKPDYIPAHFARGAALMQMGQREDAATEFENILQLRPDDPSALRLLQRVRSSP